MTELEVIKIMRQHLEGKFPKECAHCKRRYASLRDYLLHTKPAGSAIPYDVEVGQWLPQQPLGTVTYAACACGNTLALSSEGMPLKTLWDLLAWARGETLRRCCSPQALLNHLRDKITAQVLKEPQPN